MQVNSQKRENTQTTVLALLLACKGGCTLRQLDNDYYELEGERIPWKDLGHISLLSFLYSMSKTVRIENKNNTVIVKGIASEKSIHVSKLISGQKDQKQRVLRRKLYKPSYYYPKTAPPRIRIPAKILSGIIGLVNEHPDGINKDYLLQEVHSCIPFANITIQDMEEQLHELSHKIFQTNNKVYPIQSTVKYPEHLKKHNDTSSSEYRFITDNEQECKSCITSAITVAGDEDSDCVLNYDEEDDSEFTSFTRTSRSACTKSNAKTKPTSSFIKETVSKCQDPVVEHISATEIEQNNSYNFGKYEENCLHGKDVEVLINERVKFRLEKLVRNDSNGIWCADLPERYLEEYKVPLNYSELGFNSVREFASQLPEIFHCVQLHDTGDFKLYYAKREIPSNDIKGKSKIGNLAELHHIYGASDEEALPAAVSLDTCKILIPHEVLTIGEHVGYINVVDLVQNEEPFVEVIVVEVFTPSFFWIQLRKKQKIFKKFMDELHNFYSSKYEQYIIPPVVLEKGLNCACMYNGIWHRGTIKTVKPDFQVTIMFYDYGTLKTYSPEAVCYLHRMFSNLPAQAIPCGLVNTRPYKSSKWSRSTTHHFAVKTSDIPLIATIASINTEDNSMMITLTNTLEEEDVHINDWLVEQKLAEHGKMVCMKKRNFPFRYYLECQERFKQQKCSKTCKVETNSENKAALYNLNSHVDLSRDERISNNFLESDFSNDEKTYNSVLNSERKPQRKIESLYENLLNLKLKSIHSTKTNNSNNNNNNNNNNNDNDHEINENVENKKFLGSSLVLHKAIEQESSKESVKSCHDNVIYGFTKSDISFDDLFSDNRKNNEVSNNKYDILKKHNNIPNQYANCFHVRDPENELDISHMKTFIDTHNYEHEEECTDCSVLWENAMRERKCVSQKNEFKIPHKTILKKRDNIPLAENSFLKAVYNSSYFASHDKDIPWSPTGNIDKMYDVSPLILKNIEKRKKSITNKMTIVMPQKILETLKLSRACKNENEVQCCINSSHEVGNISTDNFKYTNGDEILFTENFEQNSDNKENDYINMKVFAPKQKLLQKLLSMKDTSSNVSTLDYDDLSTSEKSISFDCNVDTNDVESEKEEYEKHININKGTLSEFCSEIDTKCLSHSIETDIADLHMEEPFKYTINELEVRENKTSVSTSETSALTNNLESVEELSVEPILMQESTLTVESDLIKNCNYTEESSLNVKGSVETLVEEPLLTKEIQTHVVQIEESTSSNIVTETASISVFNDYDIESDEEEWDVNVSYADVCNLLKINCFLDKNIQDQFNHEQFNSQLKIKEVDDSNSMDSANENTEDDSYESLYSNRIIDDEVCLNVAEPENLMNEYEISETQMTVINSEKSSEISNKYTCNAQNTVPYKLQGKARTLVEMLNKVKLLQKDC